MKLYNSATKKLQKFTPQDPDHVKIYTCGPTVYDYVHVGNLTSYIYWDLLLRTLQATGYQPYRVLNLTDVGHLTSDADQGEDKIEKGAKKLGRTVWEVAEHYSTYFLQKMSDLNLLPPDKIAKATDYIPASIELIDLLTAKGFTYEINDGIYFDTSKLPEYADFARLDLEHIQAGARVEFNSEKRHASDFALWKFIQPGEDHAMRWNYKGRNGYPGWHIECSSIIHQELGEPIDIHTGGIDHIPVHHTNEIAQSQAAFGQTLSRFWLHCNFITIDGQKISKSLGNTYTLEQLQEQGFSPLDFKLWVLQGHYQTARNFSINDLASAKARRLSWRNRLAEARQLQDHPAESTPLDLEHNILAALQDNLNSALAFSLIDTNYVDLKTWQFIDQLFALGLFSDSPDITPAQEQLISTREHARAQKDFATADSIRDQLQAQNLTVLDTPHGPIWQYLK